MCVDPNYVVNAYINGQPVMLEDCIENLETHLLSGSTEIGFQYPNGTIEYVDLYEGRQEQPLYKTDKHVALITVETAQHSQHSSQHTDLEEGLFLQVVDVYEAGSQYPFTQFDIPGFFGPAQFEADCGKNYKIPESKSIPRRSNRNQQRTINIRPQQTHNSKIYGAKEQAA